MSVIDILFPNHSCLICGDEINSSKHLFVCDVCVGKLPYHENVCDKCGREVSLHSFLCDDCKSRRVWHFSRARSVFCYQSPVIELVLGLKYNACGDVAKFVAPLFAEIVAKYGYSADMIIPVPLSTKREKERGYNQSGLIAAELSNLLGVPVADNVLVRVRHTWIQKNMSFAKRKENLHGAFEISGEKVSGHDGGRRGYTKQHSVIKGKRVLLVDDVFTSGATTDECARVLKKLKPSSIEVLTIASVNQDKWK